MHSFRLNFIIGYIILFVVEFFSFASFEIVLFMKLFLDIVINFIKFKQFYFNLVCSSTATPAI